LMKCRASSTTGRAVLHGLLRMKKSLSLNKYEMVSSHLVNLKIGEGRGPFFTPCISRRLEMISKNQVQSSIFCHLISELSICYGMAFDVPASNDVLGAQENVALFSMVVFPFYNSDRVPESRAFR
jgi:hypothetical protein